MPTQLGLPALSRVPPRVGASLYHPAALYDCLSHKICFVAPFSRAHSNRWNIVLLGPSVTNGCP
nr:MAG TPA: hypothetical protein [Caudoviricetes sp.]